MESPNPGHPGRRSLLPALLKSPLSSALLALALVLTGLAGGWWIGQRQASGAAASGATRSDPKQAGLQQELTQLRRRQERNEASDADRQRLLELLVALGRRAEAMELLEPMADREPDRWSLRLMLAELRRDQGDRLGAERELRQILSRQECHWSMETARGDWVTRTETYSSMTASATHFRITGRLEAYENGKQVLVREWDESVKRQLV